MAYFLLMQIKKADFCTAIFLAINCRDMYHFFYFKKKRGHETTIVSCPINFCFLCTGNKRTFFACVLTKWAIQDYCSLILQI